VINALRDSKGAAVACGGEKPSSEWFFSTPGWRRHCPSDAGNPSRHANKRRTSLDVRLLFM